LPRKERNLDSCERNSNATNFPVIANVLRQHGNSSNT